MKFCFFDHLLLDVIFKVSNSFSSNSLLCRVHNEVVPACDIVSQRMFRGGRTEYIRSPTNETVKFIGAFDDPSVSVSFQSATNAGLNLFIYLFLKKHDIYCLAAGGEAGAVQRSCGQSCISDHSGEWNKTFLYGPMISLLLFLFLFPALFRHLKDMELRATCWDWSWRPLKEEWAFPRSSWTQHTAWPHTGNSEQDRCVRLTVC